MPSKHAVILVVEDSQPDVLLIRRAFVDSQIDAEIVSAADGDEALAIVDGRFGLDGSDRLDLILLDISMPGLSGIDTLKQMRERPYLRATPIVMLTESRLLGDVQAALDFGATSFANKVASLGELTDLVRNIAKNWLPGSFTQPNTVKDVA